MSEWFEDKFERENVRKYTRRRISKLSGGFFRRFSITNRLIILNIILFILSSLLMYIFGEDAMVNLFALQADSFFSGKIWTVFTSMFMHASFIHLFVNMFSLFFVGNFVERVIGRKRFFWFYIISGIFAGLFFVFLSYYFGNICIFSFLGGCLGERIFSVPSTSAVGASGAIFALVGLLALLTPRNRVYLIVGPLVAIIIQAVLYAFFPTASFMTALSMIINIYILFSIFSLFSFNKSIKRISFPLEMPFWILPFIAIIPLIIIGLFVSLPIGNMAHLGGIIAGLIYAFYLKKKYKKKTEMINQMFSR